jgi:hypothetical protein
VEDKVRTKYDRERINRRRRRVGEEGMLMDFGVFRNWGMIDD